MEKIHCQFRDEQIQADFSEDPEQEKYILYSKFRCKSNKSSLSFKKRVMQPTSRLASLFNSPDTVIPCKDSKVKIQIVNSIFPSLKHIKSSPITKNRNQECRRVNMFTSKKRSGSVYRFYNYFLSKAK
jgi:hypothetical protein